jgi:hypothetical protein
VAFFVLRHEQVPAGCGGIKLFETEYGDVKRMYVRPQFRGFGFGKRVLHHLAAYALQQGVKVLRLETGIYQVEAIGLYERCGFQRIPPFGAYKDDPRPRRARLASLAVDICAPQHFRRTLKESTIRLSQRAIGHATDMPQKMHSEPPYADGPT